METKSTVMILVNILIVLAVAYGALALTLFFMQPKFMYKPLKEVTYTPNELGLDYENVTFRTADRVNLNGWFIPAENAEFTILFCHGNGGNIMHRLDSVNLFYNLGINCFIFDYRGYGNSGGETTEKGTYFDARAAYNWLTKKKKIPHENIILFGRSMGACIAAHLVAKVKSRALVIESAFTSFTDIGKKFYPYMPVKWFARFNYDTIGYVRKVHCPIMVIHSRSDDLVPFEFGLELYQAANEPKEFVEIFGSHNDGFLISGETYKQAWIKWLKSLKGKKAKTHTLRHSAS